jgi:hypothetical protein
MKDLEALTKINEAIKAIEEYENKYKEDNVKGLWHNDIQEKLPLLIEKSHVLGAIGQTCVYCGGTGRK